MMASLLPEEVLCKVFGFLVDNLTEKFATNIYRGEFPKENFSNNRPFCRCLCVCRRWHIVLLKLLHNLNQIRWIQKPIRVVLTGRSNVGWLHLKFPNLSEPGKTSLLVALSCGCLPDPRYLEPSTEPVEIIRNYHDRYYYIQIYDTEGAEGFSRLKVLVLTPQTGSYEKSCSAF